MVGTYCELAKRIDEVIFESETPSRQTTKKSFFFQRDPIPPKARVKECADILPLYKYRSIFSKRFRI